MATGTSELVDLTEDTDKDTSECAVCLQPYVYPAQLPCGHIFCFLCIKGTANQSKRCAMCRQEIPRDFIEKPNLLKNKCGGEVDTFEGCYQWFYEGRNGWWQYDERTSKELEAAYKSGDRTCELLIAGFLYVMDFDAMLQLRRNDPSRRRRMKRDLITIDKKGVAGLRAEHSPVIPPNPQTACNESIIVQETQVTNPRLRTDFRQLEGSQLNESTVTDISSDSDEDIPMSLEGQMHKLNCGTK